MDQGDLELLGCLEEDSEAILELNQKLLHSGFLRAKILPLCHSSVL